MSIRTKPSIAKCGALTGKAGAGAHFFRTVLFCFFGLVVLAQTASGQAPVITNNAAVDDPAEPVKDSLTERGSHNFTDMGSWIWDTNTFDRQTVRFWKSFTIPPGSTVTRARLRLTADNEYVFYLDGRELGRDAEWRHLYEYDITALLGPGPHVLAIEAYNSSREAGFVTHLVKPVNMTELRRALVQAS